jgi:hypothetical protein
LDVLLFHVTLALLLFFLVNWIGKYAIDFGYSSTTLFEEPNESIALNFFLRALSPAVYLIALSVVAVSLGFPDLRLEIYWVAVYYYAIRAIVIFVLNRQIHISWLRYMLHAAVGIMMALVAYFYLILPNLSLLPELEQAGNELWLALIAFLYAVANKINLPEGPGAKRRNAFIKLHYENARQKFGTQIDSKIKDDLLKLITYSILVYEDYARPKTFRYLERLIFWKEKRTTGIMQVSSRSTLSDEQSVEEGTNILLDSWKKHKRSKKEIYEKVDATIADYNRDDAYVSKVNQVLEILANRVEPKFKRAYLSMWPE